MKILFTADLHGDIDAMKRFVDILDSQDYSVGIIGGDLFTKDLIGRNHEEEVRIASIIELLYNTKKPILVIRGNHDRVTVNSNRNVQSIHMRKIKVGQYNIIGYGYNKPRISKHIELRELEILKNSVDGNTILVTHKPPCELVRLKRPEYSECLKSILEEKKPKLYLFGHFYGAIGRKSIGIAGSYAGTGKFVSIDLL